MVDTHILSEFIVSKVNIPPSLPHSPSLLLDKILGVIFGAALGDALGARTEFLTSSEAKSLWTGQEYNLLDWPEFLHGPLGDWTDDTDQMILILQSYNDSSIIDPKDFAARLLFWRDFGFSELGDTTCSGIGFTVKNVLLNENFPREPALASLQVWTQNKCDLVGNGALMRTSILGVINYQDITQVIKQTIDIGITTHCDPRALAACLAETSAIALMLQGVDSEVSAEVAENISRVFIEKYTEELGELIRVEFDQGVHEVFLTNKYKYSREILDRYLDCEFEDLLPIDGEDQGFAYICLGCAFWAVRQEVWIDGISRIILEGGDADTNAAAAGSILGCKVGFRNLPQDLISQLIHKPWLDEQINKLLSIMNLQSPN